MQCNNIRVYGFRTRLKIRGTETPRGENNRKKKKKEIAQQTIIRVCVCVAL